MKLGAAGSLHHGSQQLGSSNRHCQNAAQTDTSDMYACADRGSPAPAGAVKGKSVIKDCQQQQPLPQPAAAPDAGMIKPIVASGKVSSPPVGVAPRRPLYHQLDKKGKNKTHLP